MLWYQNILDVRDIGYKYHELLIHNVHSILGKLKFYNLTWTNLSDINKWRTLAVLYINLHSWVEDEMSHFGVRIKLNLQKWFYICI